MWNAGLFGACMLGCATPALVLTSNSGLYANGLCCIGGGQLRWLLLLLLLCCAVLWYTAGCGAAPASTR
jgi:hypothetical protein